MIVFVSWDALDRSQQALSKEIEIEEKRTKRIAIDPRFA
jgi:hypothetical protein